MSPENTPQTPEAIMAFITHFQKSRIMLTAFELGIFTLLDKDPLSSAEAAILLKTDARATDRLMNAVCALGFMQKKDNIFLNTDAGSKFLVKGKPAYIAGLHHTNSLWDTWSTLTSAVRAGTAVVQRPADINERESDWLEAFIGAMHYRGVKQAGDMMACLDLKDTNSMLDMGGGSGVFAMAFVNLSDTKTATVFDLPNVKPIAEKYIAQAGMSERIDVISGDYNIDPFPQGYDLVLLSAVIHINSWQGNAELIGKCTASLNPGGRIVIQDHVMDESRVSPPGGALFALNMLVGTKEGDTYTEADMCEWFGLAGLRFEQRLTTLLGNNLVIAVKD